MTLTFEGKLDEDKEIYLKWVDIGPTDCFQICVTTRSRLMHFFGSDEGKVEEFMILNFVTSISKEAYLEYAPAYAYSVQEG